MAEIKVLQNVPPPTIETLPAALVPCLDNGRARCQYVFIRGNNQGNQCDKVGAYASYCKAHAKIKAPGAAATTELPPVPQKSVMEMLGSKGAPPKQAAIKQAPQVQPVEPEETIVIPAPRNWQPEGSELAGAANGDPEPTPSELDLILAKEDAKIAKANRSPSDAKIEADIAHYYFRYPLIKERMPPESRAPDIPPEEWLADMKAMLSSTTDGDTMRKLWVSAAIGVQEITELEMMLIV